MEKYFRKHHWKFFYDEDENCIFVYEERDGDVIGGFYNIEIEELEKKIENYSEEELYDFICHNIEWC